MIEPCDRLLEHLGGVANQMARLLAAAVRIQAAASSRPQPMLGVAVAGSVPWTTDRISGHPDLVAEVNQAYLRARQADAEFKKLMTSAAVTTGVDEFDRHRLEIADLHAEFDQLRNFREMSAAEVDALEDLHTRVTDNTHD